MRGTRLLAGVLFPTLMFGAACRASVVEPGEGSCVAGDGAPIDFGFYAFFPPVSYSEDPDPASPEFGNHRGYEADLLTALEAMDDRLTFVRRPIPDWPGIWLLPATSDLDIVGGGITTLESRTLDDSGQRAIAFTSGHIVFRQSLLVREEDAERLASYANLTSDVRVGVLRGTTGEARLLQITGLADGEGVLARDTRIETPDGTVVADGTARYTITAATVSAGLEGRTRIDPPSAAMPQVVYLGDVSGEEELLSALRDDIIDAIARGEVGNGEAARTTDDRFVVAAVDTLEEYGGFALDADDVEMVACLDGKLDWLTDERRIGYAEWREHPGVFLARAALWDRG